MSYSRNKKYKHAFTIIEILVFLFIFVVSTLSIYEAFNVGINYIIETKKRLAAVSLANEQIELMRNIGYENLATGSSGDVLMTKNGMSFYVNTNINHADDPEDGLQIDDEDDINWDYKRINIQVKWALGNPNKLITMNAIVVPPVREEDANLGYLRLRVLDQIGSGLGGASVTVTDLSDSEVVYSGAVNSSGLLFLTGLDPELHQINVNDTGGIFPVQTWSNSGDLVYDDTHVNINAKQASQASIVTDAISDLNVSVVDIFDHEVSGLHFDIEGGRHKYRDNGEAPPDEVYYFSDTSQGEDGSESFSEMSYGPYFFDFTDLNDGTTDYHFLWMDPFYDQENKIMLDAGTTLDAKAVMAADNIPSLFVTVIDNVADPVTDAQVKLELTSNPATYSEEQLTNRFGKVYFPLTEGTITDDVDYNITIIAPGFDTYTDTVRVDDFTSEEITLDES